MANPLSPQVGYNTNVVYRGQSYHVQTEDSGVNHPHVNTHVFADGGRIIASMRTSYAEHRKLKNLPAIVVQIMKEQHKSVLHALKNGEYDTQLGLTDLPPAPRPGPTEDKKALPATSPLQEKTLREVVLMLLERDFEA